MVSLVPRAYGHTNVPVGATFYTQLVISDVLELDGHMEKSTSMRDNCVHPLNIYEQLVIADMTVFGILGAEVSEVHPLNRLLKQKFVRVRYFHAPSSSLRRLVMSPDAAICPVIANFVYDLAIAVMYGFVTPSAAAKHTELPMF